MLIPLWAKRAGEFIEIRHKKISPTHILNTLGCLSLCNFVTLWPMLRTNGKIRHFVWTPIFERQSNFQKNSTVGLNGHLISCNDAFNVGPWPSGLEHHIYVMIVVGVPSLSPGMARMAN